MSKKATAELFRPKAIVKADQTTEIAQAIMAEETAARVAKTARLKAARLAQEAAAPPPVKKPRRAAAKAKPAAAR
ncbi:hypothetical protein OSH08_18365 [Kaistia geumhonensis]|uniref:Transcriptional regulator n=1 Tax=Kaistia geumhonensis TaxID=410839 RepID=A0ABU0MAT6_9HYPH|nr:hypothetical protein [Kaistia geumhonensis]MCX5480970.1 hypothetical protein [Kaistia geumhonensis]MDQ0518027.1 hypothetical protein [Kaistia geumhonensis]